MSRTSRWYDDLEDDFGELDGEVSYWAEDLVETDYGVVPEQSDSYIPPDKQTMKAERHQKRLQRQRAEAKKQQLSLDSP